MKTLLSLCLFGVIGTCPDKPVPAATEPVSEPPQKMMIFMPRETLAGDFLSGQFAQKQQDWKAADKYITRVMEYDPENPDLQRRAMVLAMGAGEVNRAIAMARKILELEPTNQLALLFLSLDHFSRQDYAGATQTLTGIPAGSIGELVKPILMSWAGAGQGRVDLSALDINNPLHAYHALLISDYMGQVANAEKYVQKIMTNSAIDFYAAEKIADVLARNNMKDSALGLYQLLQKQQPENKSLDDRIENLTAGRASSYERLSSPGQGAAEAMFDMARLLYREQSDDSAMVFTRMALHLNPELTEARLVLAGVLSRTERYDEAITQFKSITGDKRVYLEAQRQAGMLLEKNGRTADAIYLLNTLYASHQDVESLILIGDIHRRAEDYTAALDVYNRAAAAIGGNAIPESYWHLLYARGMTHERAGDMDKADADLRAALAYRPNHPYMLNYLGYSWVDRGKNLDEALKMIEQAVALRPDDGYITDSLGWAFYRMGRYAEAVEVLEKAVALVPYDSTINDHLGDAYWQTGRKMEARFEWTRALNSEDDEAKKSALQAKLDSGLSAVPSPPVQEAKGESARVAR